MKSDTYQTCFSSHWVAITLLFFLLFPTGCLNDNQEDGQPVMKLSPQHIILIGIDTLRKDHLSCYGYPIQTTPAIDAFAEAATLYERSISSSPWTLPSFASIFTSQYLHEHKSGLDCKKGDNDKRQFPTTILNDSATTLAEVLQNAGYETAAFTEGVFMSPAFGVSQGFDLYKVCSVPDDKQKKIQYQNTHYKDIKNVVNTVLEWIQENKQKNFFLFMHTYEPHDPFRDPMKVFEKTKEEYIQNGLLEQMQSCYLERAKKIKGYNRESTYNFLCEQRMLYDCEIKYTDHHMGRFFNELKKMGIYDKSLIIFTSDHGEEFGEHGEMNHHKNLYQTSIAVPLIIKNPGQRKGIRENGFVAEGVDIMPTVLAACQIDMKGLTLSGQSLSSKQATNIARAHLFAGKKKNLAVSMQGDQKTIFNYDAPGELALFNLRQDPLEKNPTYTDQGSAPNLKKYIEPKRIPATVGIPCFDEYAKGHLKIKKMLKTLGYIE